jgi:hypothetical protein
MNDDELEMVWKKRLYPNPSNIPEFKYGNLKKA